jgi:hypothetical protein
MQFHRVRVFQKRSVLLTFVGPVGWQVGGGLRSLLVSADTMMRHCDSDAARDRAACGKPMG